jgi:hypothetical protein
MDEATAARIDELYTLPLERFVPERDVLAKELKAEGLRAEGADVAALQKPSMAAWAVNQVVRSQPQAARSLWEAGDAVLDAQEQVMAGEGGAAELRTAIERERAALAPLRDAARGLVTANGRFLGDQNVDTVTETLHAAAVDREARETVAAGQASRPLQLAGIAGAVATGAPPPRQRAPAPPADGDRLADRQAADDAAERERREAERAQRARRAELQRALVRAEQDRERARERVAQAVDARDTATVRVEAALQELGAAEDDLGRAEQALSRGHEALEQAEGAVERAREDVEGA